MAKHIDNLKVDVDNAVWISPTSGMRIDMINVWIELKGTDESARIALDEWDELNEFVQRKATNLRRSPHAAKHADN